MPMRDDCPIVRRTVMPGSIRNAIDMAPIRAHAPRVRLRRRGRPGPPHLDPARWWRRCSTPGRRYARHRQARWSSNTSIHRHQRNTAASTGCDAFVQLKRAIQSKIFSDPPNSLTPFSAVAAAAFGADLRSIPGNARDLSLCPVLATAENGGLTVPGVPTMEFCPRMSAPLACVGVRVPHPNGASPPGIAARSHSNQWLGAPDWLARQLLTSTPSQPAEASSHVAGTRRKADP